MLFTDADKKSIEAAVAAAELKSAGEIVVAHVRQSDDYDAERGLVAALAFMTVTFALQAFLPELTTLLAVGVSAVCAVLTWLVLGLPGLRRQVVSEARRHDAARLRASQLFLQRGIHCTRDRTGVLIFISELERQVVMIGDSGINAQLADHGWQDWVQVITTAIRKDSAAQGVVNVVNALGEVLAQHFPRRSDDTNELPDAVISDA